MLDALLLFYVLDVPFLTAPVRRPDFPVAVELLADTSDIPLSTNTYAWISQHEIRAEIRMGPADFMTTILVLNPDGTAKEERENYENSDSLFFVEKYTYQDGQLLTWQGSVETATCSYRDGRLDSIHMLNVDNVDAEEFYFKLRYDSLGRLAGADRMTIVPNSNPGPDRRITLDYEDAGTITVRRFPLPPASDTTYRKVLLKDGRIHEILSSMKSDRTGFRRIRRFTYPEPARISMRPPRPHPLRIAWLKGRDILGREAPRQGGSPLPVRPDR